LWWFSSDDSSGSLRGTVLQVGKYELSLDAGWAEGDWTGDQRFDSTDLIAALADGGNEQGARFGVRAVPEPAATLDLVNQRLGPCS
jgi:hypothetical protein